MSPVLRQILPLDPVTDCQLIIRLSMRQDFPFDSTRALELALFRTYCSPRISSLLAKTREFELRAQKRYDDTDIIVSTLIEHGYDSEPGRTALRRMNQLHARFAIPNEDFLYVLSTFVLEPLHWNARNGWRPLTERERQAYFHFFKEVGRRMGIKDIPETLAAFTEFSDAYEETHFHFADSNKSVGTATLDMMCQWFPKPLHPLVRRGVYATLAAMNPHLLTCFNFPHPTRLELTLLRLAMRTRALILRLLPRRRKPYFRTTLTPRSYPDGYALAALGPPPPSP